MLDTNVDNETGVAIRYKLVNDIRKINNTLWDVESTIHNAIVKEFIETYTLDSWYRVNYYIILKLL